MLALAACERDRPADPGLSDQPAATAGDGAVTGASALVAPTDSVAVARPGHRLVLPVAVEPGFVPSAGALVRLDDGTRVTARLWWVSFRPAPWDQRVRASTDPVRAWLAESAGGAGGWSVWSATRGDLVRPMEAAGVLAAEAGQWVLVADLPRNSKAQRLWVGETPGPGVVGVPIVWWTGLEPEHLALFGEDDAPMWSRSPWLTRSLAAAAVSPMTRWRAELLGAAMGRTVEAPGPSPDPVLDLVGERLVVRWTAALLRLESVDPTLARRTLWTAAGVVDFGGAVVAPLWTDDSAELAALVAGVLDPTITDEQAAARAEAWLASRPQALAWVIDDAGAPEPTTQRPVVTVGVVNRTLITEPATIEAESSGGGAVFAATPPMSARRVSVPVPLAESGGATRLNVRMCERTLVRAAAAAPTPVMPPGLRVGPLVRDWTQARFASAAANPEPAPSEMGVVDNDWSTAALLQRATPAGPPERGNGAGGGGGRGVGDWMLYVECRVGAVPDAPEDAPATDPQRDSVRLWIGAFGAPLLVLRVTGDAKVELEDSRSRLGADWATLTSATGGVTVRRTDTGWACWIPIPAGAVEADGTLRIALERTDPRGVRTAWPRAMLPWQREPGRAWADLGAWEGRGR